MTAITVMAMAMQRELMARGYASPSIDVCETILRRAIDCAAEINDAAEKIEDRAP